MKTVGRRPKLEAEGQERGVVLGEGHQAPPARGSGGALWAPHHGSGRSPDHCSDHPKIFNTIFSTKNGFSWHYNIVLLWITKNEIFLTHSILSQLLCIWWCFLMFLIYETKFTVGKWQVVVFTAGKRIGRWGRGKYDTWGNPPSSAELRPRALAHRSN